MIDGGRQPDVTYQYEVVGVDANRQPASLYLAYFDVTSTSYESCGVAPIAHGTVEDFGYTLRVESCAGACYDSGFGLMETFPAGLEAYVGTGIPLLFYGRIGCGGIEGCSLLVDSVVEQSCTVGVEPSSGWAMLTAEGGHAGNDLKHAIIRRWTARRDCTVKVEERCVTRRRKATACAGRLVSSREGAGDWNLHRKSADTQVSGITLKQSDTLDFVVDCGPRGDYTFDGFVDDHDHEGSERSRRRGR